MFNYRFLLPFIFAVIFNCSITYAQSTKDSQTLDDPYEAARIIREQVGEVKAFDHNQKAEYYYEFEVGNSPCVHCPEYVGLIKEVNDIAKKSTEQLSVKEENKVINELSKLQFMYYQTVSTLENGQVSCEIFNNQNALNPNGIHRDELTLLAEKMIDIKSIKSFHFNPQGTGEELRYYYRGDGAQSDVIIEVVVFKDKSAKVRYHHYRPMDGQLDYLGDLPNLATAEDGPKDHNFDKRFEITKAVDLHAKSNIDESNQEVDLNLKNSKGNDFLKVNTVHTKNGEVNVNTVIPAEITFPSKNDLKLNAKVGNNQSFNYKSSDRASELNYGLALTDMNHEYLNAEIVSKESNKNDLKVNSKLKIAKDSTLSIGVDQKEDGIGKYKVGTDLKLSDSAVLNANINRDSQGNQDYGLSTKVDLNENVDLEAQFGRSNKGTEQVVVSTNIDVNKNIDLSGSVKRNEKGFESVAVGGRFSLGKSGELQTDFSQARGEVGTRDNREITVGHSLSTAKSTFTTSYSVDEEKKSKIKFQTQKRISQNTSMSFSFERAEDVNFMFQLESKF